MRRLLLLVLFLVPMAGAVLSGAASTDLFVAIRNGDHAHVQQLLRCGAAANAADSDGTTALMHAVVESDVTMMRLLWTTGLT